MEAIILAGGRGERLGDEARGRPKALVDIAGSPLITYQVELLRRAGVQRIIVSCARGQAGAFKSALPELEREIVYAEEPERLGRGGGLRFAAEFRQEKGPVFALNGDELLALDLRAVQDRQRDSGAAAAIVVAPLRSSFGIVDMDEEGCVLSFVEAPVLPYWVNAGAYVLSDEALDLLPLKGDHEESTFPQLARERRLVAYRHTGVWLTVNTPKDLRKARSYIRQYPNWLASMSDSVSRA